MIDLRQGDCLEMLKDIPDGSVDMVMTDMPYNITKNKWDTAIDLQVMWQELNRIVKPNGAMVFTAVQPFTTLLIASNIKNYKYEWVWVKNLKTGNLNARRMPMGGHETIQVFYKKSPTYNPQKRQRTTEVRSGNKYNSKTKNYGSQKEFYDDRQSDLINPDTVITNIKCVHNSSGKVHPTQKPVELMEYLIKTYTNEQDVVIDMFMGSGSTGVACVNTNRQFIGIELDKDYFAVANKRIKEAQDNV